jgi:hypothetical protein
MREGCQSGAFGGVTRGASLRSHAEKWVLRQQYPTNKKVGQTCWFAHFSARASNAMRRRLESVWIFLAICLLVAAGPVFSAEETPASQAVLFRNGDALPGHVESLVPGKELRWNHPDVEKPIVFRTDNLAQIANRAPRQDAPTGGRPCVVQFTNMDELSGDLLGLTATNVTLNTWHAGEVTLPRNRVRLIRPIPTHFKTIYAGPTGTNGWTSGDVSIDDAGVWTYANGAFYATKAASIASIVNLPDKSSLEFEIAWRETFNLAVALYTDYLHPISLSRKENEPDFGGFYSLQINPRTINLLHVTKTQPLRYLGPLAVRAFDNKNRAHIAIRCGKAKRSVSLFVDGQLIKQWIDDRGFGGEGRGIRLVHQGLGSVRLNNLKVKQWDGRFEMPPSLPPNSAQDVVLTAAGQRLFGEVLSIAGDGVMLRGGQGALKIPWRDAVHLELAPAKAARLTPEPGYARAWFDARRSVRFKLEKWEKGRITGSSANFGRLSFDAGAFRQVEFLNR